MSKPDAPLPDHLRFVKIPNWILDSAEYSRLSGPAAKLYLAIFRRFNGSNNGNIAVSVLVAIKATGLSRETIVRCFKELCDAGLVERTSPGGLGPNSHKAATYRLTHLKCDRTNEEPAIFTDDYGRLCRRRERSEIPTTTVGKTDRDGRKNRLLRRSEKPTVQRKSPENRGPKRSEIPTTYDVPSVQYLHSTESVAKPVGSEDSMVGRTAADGDDVCKVIALRPPAPPKPPLPPKVALRATGTDDGPPHFGVDDI